MDIDFSHWGPGFDAYMGDLFQSIPNEAPPLTAEAWGWFCGSGAARLVGMAVNGRALWLSLVTLNGSHFERKYWVVA